MSRMKKYILEIADTILKSTCSSMRVPNFKPIHQNPSSSMRILKAEKIVSKDFRRRWPLLAQAANLSTRMSHPSNLMQNSIACDATGYRLPRPTSSAEESVRRQRFLRISFSLRCISNTISKTGEVNDKTLAALKSRAILVTWTLHISNASDDR